MSEENVEIVERAIKILQDGDPRDVFTQGLAAPDARWHAAELAGAGTYVGAEGFVEFMAIWTENFQD